MILSQARMFSFFVKTTAMLTGRCNGRTSGTEVFIPKRASFPQFFETWNSGVKVSDPELSNYCGRTSGVGCVFAVYFEGRLLFPINSSMLFE